jgi:hypothetical protein
MAYGCRAAASGYPSTIGRAEAFGAAPCASISGKKGQPRPSASSDGTGGGQVKKPRRHWKPSSAQLATIVDCSVARMPLEKAAALIGVGPRTLRSFSKRVEAARVVDCISAKSGENAPKDGPSA